MEYLPKVRNPVVEVEEVPYLCGENSPLQIQLETLAFVASDGRDVGTMGYRD
jgi:hypothetical protein